jgi:hypothetical protein
MTRTGTEDSSCIFFLLFFLSWCVWGAEAARSCIVCV